jgi:hypothetical protein
MQVWRTPVRRDHLTGASHAPLQFEQPREFRIPSGGNPLRANETGRQIPVFLVAGEE